MLYLEDFLELIENLPQECRERLTEMREMDLQVQNTVDTLDNRTKLFFANAKKMKQPERDAEYEAIRKDYYKTLEDSDIKVQLANHMHDLVTRYLRRLEQDTMKFKMELEADNAGITEVLEKRAEEPDLPPPPPPTTGSQKENRYSFNSHRSSVNNVEVKKESGISEKRMTASVAEVKQVTTTAPGVPAVNYNLNQLTGGALGAGGTAIAAAASQAIAATQQMQQGRRTASLKASYDAINTSVGGPELSISKELAGAAHTAIQAVQDTNKKATKKQKVQPRLVSSPSPVATVTSRDVPETPQNDTAADTTYDPNEPHYCVCNDVAFGDMVGCDNPACPYEWFHYPCVGILDPPKGKWFCPLCTAAMKRRGSRKN